MILSFSILIKKDTNKKYNKLNDLNMKCEICGKTSVMGGLTKKLRGRINPTGKRWKRANIQGATVNGKKIKACTRCIRTLNKNGKA